MPPSGLPRWVDVAASVTGLVLLSPVLVAAAVVIKIDSPGPVLFTQERVGRDGRIFELVKLRNFRSEIGEAMALSGCATIADIDRSLIT